MLPVLKLSLCFDDWARSSQKVHRPTKRPKTSSEDAPKLRMEVTVMETGERIHHKLTRDMLLKDLSMLQKSWDDGHMEKRRPAKRGPTRSRRSACWRTCPLPRKRPSTWSRRRPRSSTPLAAWPVAARWTEIRPAHAQ